MTRRVVITGVGLVSPLGQSADQLWDALLNRRSGVGPLESLPTRYLPTCYGAEARGFTGNITDFGELEKVTQRNIRKGLKVMCREIQMGVAVAQHALADARLNPEVRDPDRTGVVYGSDYIMTLPEEFSEGIRRCLNEDDEFDFKRWADEGLPKVDPLWLLKYLPNMPASHIAIYNDLRGPNNSITVREASSNMAMCEAYCTIVRGSADAIVVGATGTRVHPLRTLHVTLQEQLAANGSEPERMSRPFDLERTGMVVGEGAGALVLEELNNAQARGANILGEVTGYGSSTVMDRRGVAQCDAALRNALVQALRTSGLSPQELGHIHAHGLATQKCDMEEAQAIKTVCGDTKVPVTAAKSYFGNLGAGGGIVELIASLWALRQGHLFPILNYETPDPACPIHAVRSNDVPAGDNFVNLNVTPQGQASAIVVRRFAG